VAGRSLQKLRDTHDGAVEECIEEPGTEDKWSWE
jgi:hypothetical protein